MLNPRVALLQALLDAPGYGLELAERIRATSYGQINLGQGTLYPTLRGMERDGLIKSWQGEPMPERGGRPRIYYELTAEGLRTARAERQAIASVLGLVEAARS